MELNMNDLTDMIINYEMGELDDTDVIALFQELIDTGLAWRLQGWFGRHAMYLIGEGLCKPPKVEKEVYNHFKF